VVRRLALALLAAGLVGLAPPSAHAAVGIVRAETSLPSGPYRFGEAIRADLDVLVNTKLVDPDGVRADVSFAPYDVLSAKRSTLHDGHVTRVRFRYLLQCASLACTLAPGKLQRQITFPAATLAYADREGKKRSAKVFWQPTVLVTRVSDPLSRPQTATQARQEIPSDPLLRLPVSVTSAPPSYRIQPLTLGLVLLAAAIAALVAAVLVARPLLALLRGAEAAAPRLSPLEQAVVAVESAGQHEPGSPDHREALALLARQLRRANLNELVNGARKLAWSEQAPTAAASRALTSDVRARMGSQG
jgi:hypothetical protein